MLQPIILAAALARAAETDWRKSFDSLRKTAEQTAASSTKLSEGEIAAGLKEALDVGVRKSVASLGTPDGFLKAADVHIPLPEKLRTLERLTRKIGMGRKADEFETTLNRAAESAVVESAKVFADSLKKMTLEDARAVLSGPEDSATNYFSRTSREKLRKKFLPIVHDATRRAGVTRSYATLVDGAGPLFQLTGSPPDLDEYVGEKALDALFLRIKAEEKEIRRNPAARATALMKKVFGS